MNTKYKLKSFVKFTANDVTKFGQIDSVLRDSNGNTFYKLDKEETFIPEEAILTAYTEVTPRKPRGPRKKKTFDHANSQHAPSQHTV